MVWGKKHLYDIKIEMRKMKEQDKLIRIGREVAKVLKELKEVKAIAFYGAIVAGFADKYSDIDIICLCSKIPPKKSRKKFLNKLKGIKLKEQRTVLITHFGQDLLIYKNKKVGVTYNPIDYIKREIELIKKRAYVTEDNAIIMAHIYNTKIISDPYNIFKDNRKILGILAKKPKWLLKFFLSELDYFFKKKEYAKSEIEIILNRKNYIWLNKRLQIFLDKYITILYAINNCYLNNFLVKWTFKQIKNFKYKPKNCVKRLERISLLGNKPEELREKFRIFESLVEDTKKFVR